MDPEIVSKVKSINALKALVKTHPDSFSDDNKKLVDSLPSNPMGSKYIFLTVVGIVGIVLIACITLGAIIILKSDDYSAIKVPDFIVTIAGTSLGALVGLLAPNPQTES